MSGGHEESGPGRPKRPKSAGRIDLSGRSAPVEEALLHDEDEQPRRREVTVTFRGQDGRRVTQRILRSDSLVSPNPLVPDIADLVLIDPVTEAASGAALADDDDDDDLQITIEVDEEWTEDTDFGLQPPRLGTSKVTGLPLVKGVGPAERSSPDAATPAALPGLGASRSIRERAPMGSDPAESPGWADGLDFGGPGDTEIAAAEHTPRALEALPSVAALAAHAPSAPDDWEADVAEDPDEATVAAFGPDDPATAPGRAAVAARDGVPELPTGPAFDAPLGDAVEREAGDGPGGIGPLDPTFGGEETLASENGRLALPPEARETVAEVTRPHAEAPVRRQTRVEPREASAFATARGGEPPPLLMRRSTWTTGTELRGELGRYVLVGHLGATTTTETHLAYRVDIQPWPRPVAVRRLLDPGVGSWLARRYRFLQRARVGRNLQHPGLLAVLDHGHRQDVPFLVTEVADGLNLRALVAFAGRDVSAQVVAEIGRQALEALAYLHDFVDEAGIPRGLVHGEVGPATVRVTREGQVRLGEPAGSTAVEAEQPGAAAPEQLAGHRIDRRADIFALGVCLAEVMIGGSLAPGGVPDPVRSADLIVDGGRRRGAPEALISALLDMTTAALDRRPSDTLALAERFGRMFGDGDHWPDLGRALAPVFARAANRPSAAPEAAARAAPAPPAPPSRSPLSVRPPPPAPIPPPLGDEATRPSLTGGRRFEPIRFGETTAQEGAELDPTATRDLTQRIPLDRSRTAPPRSDRERPVFRAVVAPSRPALAPGRVLRALPEPANLPPRAGTAAVRTSLPPPPDSHRPRLLAASLPSGPPGVALGPAALVRRSEGPDAGRRSGPPGVPLGPAPVKVVPPAPLGEDSDLRLARAHTPVPRPSWVLHEDGSLTPKPGWAEVPSATEIAAAEAARDAGVTEADTEPRGRDPSNPHGESPTVAIDVEARTPVDAAALSTQRDDGPPDGGRRPEGVQGPLASDLFLALSDPAPAPVVETPAGPAVPGPADGLLDLGESPTLWGVGSRTTADAPRDPTDRPPLEAPTVQEPARYGTVDETERDLPSSRSDPDATDMELPRRESYASSAQLEGPIAFHFSEIDATRAEEGAASPAPTAEDPDETSLEPTAVRARPNDAPALVAFPEASDALGEAPTLDSDLVATLSGTQASPVVTASTPPAPTRPPVVVDDPDAPPAERLRRAPMPPEVSPAPARSAGLWLVMLLGLAAAIGLAVHLLRTGL